MSATGPSDDGPDAKAALADKICRRIADAVMLEMKQNGEVMLSGDDSGLESLWEEVCVQIQTEQSIFWDAYVDQLVAAIDRHVALLKPREQDAIWFQTARGCLFSDDEDERSTKFADKAFDLAERILREYVFTLAANDAGSRVRAYVERPDDRESPGPNPG